MRRETKWLIAAMSYLFITCAWLERATAQDSHSSAALARLLKQLHALPDWTTIPNYPERGWKQMIEVAKIWQNSNSNEVIRALDALYLGEEDHAKAFLLLRVLFNLPESAATEKYHSFQQYAMWYSMYLNEHPEASANLAWPMSWRLGRPSLVEGKPGVVMGNSPPLSSEYSYMLANYPYRDLHHISFPGRVPLSLRLKSVARVQKEAHNMKENSNDGRKWTVVANYDCVTDRSPNVGYRWVVYPQSGTPRKLTGTFNLDAEKGTLSLLLDTAQWRTGSLRSGQKIALTLDPPCVSNDIEFTLP